MFFIYFLLYKKFNYFFGRGRKGSSVTTILLLGRGLIGPIGNSLNALFFKAVLSKPGSFLPRRIFCVVVDPDVVDPDVFGFNGLVPPRG